MKTTLLTATLLFIAITLSAQTYYWVGNSGNWSDLAHWATTSGGATFHNTLPGPENDVIFDANSFTMLGQVVTIDLEQTFCRDLFAAAVTNSPYITSQGFYDNINVYGDINLSSNLQRYLSVINLHNTGITNITTGEINLGGSTFIQCLGGGEYHLQDSLSTGNVQVYDGAFYTNNFPVYTSQRFIAETNNNQEVYLGTSNIYTWYWDVWAEVTLDASSATIYYGSPGNFFETFSGQSHHYNKVVFSGTVNLLGNNTYDFFEALPGTTLNLSAGSTQEAGQFIFNGNGVSGISIGSSISGQQATLLQTSGVVNGQYLTLSDNNATGGATFNANESIDLGNNSGWNITITVPQDYYWIGGTGNWTDAFNWATTSGGATFHTNPPSAIDNVYFDINSFAGADVLDLGDLSLNCNSLSISNIASNVSFSQGSIGVLNVYGDLITVPNVNFNLREIRMLNSDAANIHTQNNSLGSMCVLVLDGGGDYVLASGLDVRSLEIMDGDFNSNGHPITVDFEFRLAMTLTGNVNLSNSFVDVRIFENSISPSQLNVTNTEFWVTSSFHGNGASFHKITCDMPEGSQTIALYYTFSVDELVVEPGSSVAIQAGQTITVNQLVLNGTASEPISIESTIAGSQGYFSKSSGTVTGTNLIITDNHAIGGATFIAQESFLGSNVIGWNALTFINEATQVDVFAVYPNPAREMIFVEAQPGDQLTLFNISGRQILRQQLNNTLNQISVTELPTGMYLITLENTHSIKRASLIVE